VVTKDASAYHVALEYPNATAAAGAAARPTVLRALPAVTSAGARFAWSGGDASGWLDICDVTGRLARRLQVRAGTQHVDWDGADGDGNRVASGIYLARLGRQMTGGLARVVVLH
jgi:hypothetical protein